MKKNIFLDKKNNRQGYEEVEIAGKFFSVNTKFFLN